MDSLKRLGKRQAYLLLPLPFNIIMEGPATTIFKKHRHFNCLWYMINWYQSTAIEKNLKIHGIYFHYIFPLQIYLDLPHHFTHSILCSFSLKTKSHKNAKTTKRKINDKSSHKMLPNKAKTTTKIKQANQQTKWKISMNYFHI